MTSQPTRAEINALVARVQALPDLVKFELFDVLRDDLAAVFEREEPEVRLVRERKEALVMIGRVAEHLGLPADQAPTGEQFAQVADAVGQGWSKQRVIRLWERWSLAISAYKGERHADTAASRARRGRLRGKRKEGDTLERNFTSIKKWLATNPTELTITAHEDFVETFNASLLPEEQPLSRGNTIYRNTALSWPNIIEVARENLTLEQALDKDLAEHLSSQHADALVGLTAIARFLNRSSEKIRTLTETDTDFPTPVAHIRGHRAWLYEDLKLYKRGMAAPKRVEDERQALFMDAEELLARLGMNMESARKYIRAKRWDRIPQPEGAIVARYHYWKRDKVQAWLNHAESQKPG